MMAYQIKKYVGGYAFAMGGLDAVVFTGGIGENSHLMRLKICSGLEAFGLALDRDRNVSLNRKEGRISAGGAGAEVFVIPTNEELVIARDTLRLVTSGGLMLL
jgi:acetate kinase